MSDRTGVSGWCCNWYLVECRRGWMVPMQWMWLPVDESWTLQDACCNTSSAEMAVLLLRSEIPTNVIITFFEDILSTVVCILTFLYLFLRHVIKLHLLCKSDCNSEPVCLITSSWISLCYLNIISSHSSLIIWNEILDYISTNVAFLSSLCWHDWLVPVCPHLSKGNLLSC